jgi:hypothetical protein
MATGSSDRPKPNSNACLFRVSIGLHLHNLPILNRVDISNIALSGLTTSLWPGLEMHKHKNLVTNFDDLFGQALKLDLPHEA